jgi:hypothetical protein
VEPEASAKVFYKKNGIRTSDKMPPQYEQSETIYQTSTRMLISHELDETTAAGLGSINGHEKATDTLPGPRYHVAASVLFETINRLESAM